MRDEGAGRVHAWRAGGEEGAGRRAGESYFRRDKERLQAVLRARGRGGHNPGGGCVEGA